MTLTDTTARTLGVIADVSVIVAIGVSSILIRQLATPFQRGFFQDDESLMYPFKDSTIPAALLYGVGFSLPILAIIVIEGGKVLRKQKEGGAFARNSGYVMREVVWKVYKVCLVFWFGVVVTHFSTNVPKYAIGRLRPHFFAVCAPDLSNVSSSGFIQEAVCTGRDTDLITEARVSFPSGHSSMAVYCMLFLALYLQERFTWEGMQLLRPFLQVVFMLMAFYTCLSRVSDYKHHWSDVLAGGLLGALVAGFVFWDLRKRTLRESGKAGSEQGLLVPAPGATAMDSRAPTNSAFDATAM